MEATYYDGQTAAATPVTLEVTKNTLVISSETRRVAVWPLKDIRVIPAFHSAEALQLTSRKAADARLVVRDAAAVSFLEDTLPAHLFRGPSLRGTIATLIFFAALSAIAVYAIYTAIPHLARPAVSLIPTSFERRLGERLLYDLSRNWRPCHHDLPASAAVPDGYESLRQLAQTLWRPETRDLEINVVVVKAPVANAFTLPGGYILVTDKLLDSLESGDELAGILAHEMGHAAHRHPMVSLVQNAGLALTVNILTGTRSADFISSSAQLLTRVSFSRNLEREADDFALAVLKRNHISAAGYANFFERAARAEPANPSLRSFQSILSTHPLSEERFEKARRAVIPDPRPAMSEAQWNSIKGLCSNDKPGP